MARFSNAAEWDPGVAAAEELTPGPPALGSTYRLQVRSFGRTTPLDYRVTEFAHPSRVVVSAENSTLRSIDVIEITSGPGTGSTLTYKATLTLKGFFAVASPLLGLAFRRLGDRAAQGLRATLG
jgi:hypothetical protein